MRRLVCPKSPLMVFSELYKNVPIKLEEQLNDNYPVFIASIEVKIDLIEILICSNYFITLFHQNM